MNDGWCGSCERTHWNSICEAERLVRQAADMIEELLSTEPQMSTHSDTIARAEALLESLRSSS